MAHRQRVEYGDWQTPPALAAAALAAVASVEPATIVEPTCGTGAFLRAAHARWPRARLHGYDVDAAHVAAARAAAPDATVRVADFFAVDWDAELRALPEPLLVVGNPPWVTSAALGVLDAGNRPRKQNLERLRGLDAVTGKSNFDLSEWMLRRLVHALAGRDATVAMLIKSTVARRLIEAAAGDLPLEPIGVWRIDAQAHFAAAVDAVLFAGRTGTAAASPAPWPVFAELAARSPATSWAVIDGVLTSDARAFEQTRHLAGDARPVWRSGVKHDCAAVMELTADGAALVNGLGETVDVEDAVVYPLLKSSDLAHRRRPGRALIVPQTALAADTRGLAATAPRAWAYLGRHQAALAARKSSIYRGQPPFAIFGVGDYTFAPWKVAISGLHKRLEFALVGPTRGRPTLLDDTCYFLPFEHEPEAQAALAALGSDPAQRFLRARIFWDAKRPITKAVLQPLDLARLSDLIQGWA